MSGDRTAWVLAGLAAALYVLHDRQVALPGGALSRDRVHELAREVIGREAWPGVVDADLVTAIAEVESSFNPTATRLEPWIPHLGGPDVSAGLMQTLTSTADWVWELGARRYPRPSIKSLYDPKVSLYFGGAYLARLARWGDQARDRDWIIRAYNGGPGNATGSTATARYLAKVQQAMEVA